MKYRSLQIAWSVAWGAVAVLLVVFWVRSYSWGEHLSYTTPQRIYFGIGSDGGHVRGFFGDVSPNRTTLGWLYTRGTPERYWRGFLFGYPQRKCIWFVIPYWFFLAVSMLSGAGPWLLWRFTLRTLLIATTLVAVVLGVDRVFALKTQSDRESDPIAHQRSRCAWQLTALQAYLIHALSEEHTQTGKHCT